MSAGVDLRNLAPAQLDKDRVMDGYHSALGNCGRARPADPESALYWDIGWFMGTHFEPEELEFGSEY